MKTRYVIDYPNGKPTKPGEGKLICLGEVDKPSAEGVMIVPDIEPYLSPVDDRYVSGRSARREDLKRTGCREYEPSERKHFQKNRERDSRERVDRMVDKWFSA